MADQAPTLSPELKADMMARTLAAIHVAGETMRGDLGDGLVGVIVVTLDVHGHLHVGVSALEAARPAVERVVSAVRGIGMHTDEILINTKGVGRG